MVLNTESNGRFHTDWLNMIYPRLKLAKNLLADDGVIFISIDDNEQENLKKCCDEVFGAVNFLQLSYGKKNMDQQMMQREYQQHTNIFCCMERMPQYGIRDCWREIQISLKHIKI